MNPNSNATTILVLGILSIVLLPILGPIAWVMGNNSLRAIDMGMANPADRSNVAAGRICGMVGTGIMTLGIILTVAWLAFGLVMFRSLSSMPTTAARNNSPVTITTTPASKSDSLSSAIISGDKKSFDALLANDPSLANKPNNVGETPLFDAAFAGRKEMAEALIANGADVNATDHFGKTPLDQAKFFHKDDIVRLLESHGAKAGKSQ